MEELTIDFTKNADKLFNDSFFEIRKAKTRFVVVYGGSGSGKSVSVHQSELINLLGAKANTLVIRKYSSDIYDSCYSLFDSQARRFNMHSLFAWRYSQAKREIKNNFTSKRILFRGLDDPEKIKSIAGIQRIIVEEANQLEFKDFRELNRRARGIEDIQFILVLNPIDEDHWIKKQFVDPTGAYHDRTTVLIYNYPQNKFLTPEDIAELEALKLIDENEYNIYALGKWGIRDTKRSWLYNFDKAKHIDNDIKFLPSYPVYLSFDFNNEPFACTAWQFNEPLGTENSFLHCIKEFSGNWKIEEMCERILTTYPNSIFYVTGDRSGSNEDIGRNQTLYQIIQSLLGLSSKQMFLNTHNLEHADSRLLCNSLLSMYPHFKINEKEAPNFASQCGTAKVDNEAKNPSTLLKDRADHKNDEFDSGRYLFQTFFLEYAKRNYFRVVKHFKGNKEAA